MHAVGKGKLKFMEITNKQSVLNSSKFIFLFALFASYFFSIVHNIDQRAVDAGLVLAKIVVYPDEISPMNEYFVSSWTFLHQISKLLLSFNWSFANVSQFIIFITATLFFLGIALTINSATKSVYLSILVALIILIFQKNFGDTDYPSLFFSEHTYGMISLATATLVFGLLFYGSLFLAGLFSSLLICIHPLIGIWINAIIIISLIINKYFFQKNIESNKFIKGFILGIAFTVGSFIYHVISTENFSSQFNFEAYNNYIKFWEGHRTQTEYHVEYFLKTTILLTFGFLSLKFSSKNFSENFKFGMLCVLTSIILSSITYFLYKIFQPHIPDLIFRIMPTRFTIMHSVIGWPIIIGILFVYLKEFEKRKYVFKNFGHIFIIFIISYYSISHYKVFIKLQKLLVNNTSNQIESVEDKKFWNYIKNAKMNGYILTSYSTSTVAMRRSLKPIILDVTSFDFVTYFPNTAKSMSMIIENIYGIPFDNPPKNILRHPFLTDEDIKSNFENYSKEKWNELSKNFNFQGIIIPVNWNINLLPKAKNKNFAFYII